MSKRIITISRQCGSGGHTIGKLVSERLGVPFYDKKLIEIVSQRSGLSQETIAREGEFAPASLLYSIAMNISHGYDVRSKGNMILPDQINAFQTELIKELAEKEPCVIVGRCADYTAKRTISFPMRSVPSGLGFTVSSVIPCPPYLRTKAVDCSTAFAKYHLLCGVAMEMRQPTTNYILIPRHSSENRRYIPFGFMSPESICGDANSMLPNATLYHFGVLVSNVHNAWVRAVCGRIKSDYRYSNDIVYNNFPWPTPTDTQKAKIEATAQEILDARAKYPDSSLADLYDPLTMPPELITAHQHNDRAVMQAYGFPVKNFTESDCVAALMKLYQERTRAKS